MEIDDLERKIRDLLSRRNAILLAHNYQRPEVQDAADLTGDSLGLSIEAAATQAEVIVFSGVHFMAESSAILSPQKTVLIPRPDAGCPMADMITRESALDFKSRYPDAPLVTYINSTADVKAVTDICCTSANSVSVVNSLDARTVLMAPDRNLAHYTARFSKKMMHWYDGFCPIHERLTPDEVKAVKSKHPDAFFIAHPECRPSVVDLADKVASTSGMLDFVKKSPHKEFIIGTEMGIIHPLKKANPDKEFIPAAPHMVCANMKLTTLQDVYDCLLEMKNVVTVAPDIRQAAKASLDRMVAVKRTD
ncbi:MAG: quinolinate synthase NadA [Deltaproteobacteria bacterium]|nr:quinolinate synthase NadA [Candidatus Zymogenaceae bacterium]